MKSLIYDIKKIAKFSLKDIISGVILINLLLAIVALLKDMFFASYLGTSQEADALFLAFFIPDTTGNNLMAASIGVTCIPMFSYFYVHNDFHRLKNLIKNVVLFIFIISSLIFTILFVFKSNIISSLGGGFSDYTASLSINLLIVILPTVFLFPLSTVGISILNVYNKFIYPAFSPVLFNGVLLITAIYVYYMELNLNRGVYILASFITIAVAVSVVYLWSSVFTHMNFKKSISKTITKLKLTNSQLKDLKKVLRSFFPYFIILVTILGVQFIERYLISGLGKGNIAGLNYAYRLVQFPIWVFVAAIGTITLPSMSKYKGLGKTYDLHKTIYKALKLTLMITLPISLVLFFLRIPIISTLFQRGAFNEHSLNITSTILKGYTFGIMGHAIMQICIRIFLSMHKMLYPLAVFILTFALNIILDFILIDKIGLSAIGYGFSISSTLNAIILMILLKYKLQIPFHPVIVNAIKIFLSAIPYILILVMLEYVWHNYINVYIFSINFIFLSAAGLFSLLVYFISLRFIKAL